MLIIWTWKLTYLILGLSTQCLQLYSGANLVDGCLFCKLFSFALFLILFGYSKLGVPIKTTISANVLEEALNGTVTVRPLPIGTSVSGKVGSFFVMNGIT